MEESQYDNLLTMRGITKTFPGVKALDNVNLEVKKGSVHALMGENGAGKSTLMKILSGLYEPDSGEILIEDKVVQFKEPKDAINNGIAMIHQELSPIVELSIAENIFLGREPLKPITRFVDYKNLYLKTQTLLDEIGVKLDPRVKMKNLSVAQMQMVEIAKAISYDSKIIIMDEPTSAITDTEVEKLFFIIRMIKKQGKGIIYISHKMDEIFQISDYITVFRDGQYIGTNKAEETNNDELVQMMVGRKLTNLFPTGNHTKSDETLLEVKNFTSGTEFQNISFELKKGEILGLTGLMGSGRTEIAQALFGLRKLDQGELYIEGKKVLIKSPLDAIENKIAFVTEDRKDEGLVLPLSIKDNISLLSLNNFSSSGFVLKNKETEAVKTSISDLNVKCYSSKQLVETLSGGNQQKVVLAKWLLNNPKILILDEPTRGIDVGAKLEIYKIMNKLVESGHSIIMISSEMPEIINMADRILVLHEGRLTGVLTKEEATQEKIFQYATGHKIGGATKDGSYATN